jgi:hypothetical protein
VANAAVPTGVYGGRIRIIEIQGIPPEITDLALCDVYERTVDIGDALTRAFEELGDGNRVLY